MSDDSARPLGEWLRQRRDELGISLEQAQADTRIRARYLQALEAEDLAALPDAIVARGFLRNYAAYLKLDLCEAANRFSTKLAPPEPVPLATAAENPFEAGSFEPVALHKVPGRRSRWLWLGAAIAIAVVALGFLAWWGYSRELYSLSWLWPAKRTMTPTPTPTPTTVAVSPTLPAVTISPTRAATATTGPAPSTPTLPATRAPTWTPSPTLTPSPPVYTGIFLELVFTDTSWIQVTVDDVRSEQGTLPAGTYRSYYGKQRVELRVGNAAAVTITVNGQKLGALGGRGEVADRIFELAGGQLNLSTDTPEAGTGTVAPAAPATARPAISSSTPEASPPASPSPTPGGG